MTEGAGSDLDNMLIYVTSCTGWGKNIFGAALKTIGKGSGQASAELSGLRVA